MKGGKNVSRSVKKGPFVQEALLKRINDMNKKGEKSIKDLVKKFNDFPTDDRSYNSST